MASLRSLLLCLTIFIAALSLGSAHLTPYFYEKVCPKALPTIRNIVKKALRSEPRMGASLLRLHFHDCFVNGCDGSVLLDDIANFTGEKTAFPNINSARGFDVVDQIKTAVNKACKGNVVSCADILAVAARDSVAILGGPDYKVQLGRRDARTASRNDANTNLPAPFLGFSQLLSSFKAQGLNLKDLVVLSGAHTLGLAQCATFRNRIFNDTNINPKLASSLRQSCPKRGGDRNLKPLDSTSNSFDTDYFKGLLQKKGLLHSDQELFKGDGSGSDNLVMFYSRNQGAFSNDFGYSMIKMGNLKPLTGNAGEIRSNCRLVNNLKYL